MIWCYRGCTISDRISRIAELPVCSKTFSAESLCKLFLGLSVASTAQAVSNNKVCNIWLMPFVLTVNDTAYNIFRIFLDFSVFKWFSGFMCAVAVYTTLEITILMIWALRIPVRLVQRLLRGCPALLGPGVSHPLLCLDWNWRGFRRVKQTCTWPSFLLCVVGLCAQTAITDVPLKLAPIFWLVITHYFMQSIVSKMTASCFMQIQLCLLLF